MNSKPPKPNTEDAARQRASPFCGIIMPIAAMGQYENSHWDRVRIVLDEAIEQAGYVPRLVSESEDIGVIQARIVQNLYDDPIVVCDVSGKNANVMFELGLRLAFDKPTIVIKDDLTDYSFDTSPIEHIGYRSDLRFDDVRDFRKKVAAAIKGSVAKKEKDDSYSPFLGHFGKFKVTGLQTTEVDSQQFIVEQLKDIQAEVSRLASNQLGTQSTSESKVAGQLITKALVKNLASSILSLHEPNLSDELELYHFFERMQNELKDRNIKVSDSVFHAAVDPIIKEYKNRQKV